MEKCFFVGPWWRWRWRRLMRTTPTMRVVGDWWSTIFFRWVDSYNDTIEANNAIRWLALIMERLKYIYVHYFYCERIHRQMTLSSGVMWRIEKRKTTNYTHGINYIGNASIHLITTNKEASRNRWQTAGISCSQWKKRNFAALLLINYDLWLLYVI